MVRWSAAALLLAILVLLASSMGWLLGSKASPRDIGDANAVLAAFTGSSRPIHDIDVGARFAGRTELLDPRRALPGWHRRPREQAAALMSATRECPPGPLPARVDDPSLVKAYDWHRLTCAGGAPPADFVERPPFMHPSGRSYAALSLQSGAPAHARALHVIELSALDRARPATLDEETRGLSMLEARDWASIAHGDRVILSTSLLVLVDDGPLGIARVRLYPRRQWAEAAMAAAIVLDPRGSGVCERPASSTLCWRAVSRVDHHRAWLVGATYASAALAALAAIALAVGYARERRRAHADRLDILRTLTHELRTPATSLGLDIEPLRAAYDELPASCQEPVLRLVDGVARLNRVLHRTAKYMVLFDGRTTGAMVAAPEPVPSVRALFDELAAEWPEDVVVKAGSSDGAIVTDSEWLSIALRNLVENAERHGKPGIVVTWRLEGSSLVIRVADAGATPAFSLRRAISPYHRDPKSPGLGLGLAIVARVARLLSGTLRHEPNPTTFELRVNTDLRPRPS